ncbi:hypothetical protein D3C80_1903950 [compost metagenome]
MQTESMGHYRAYHHGDSKGDTEADADKRHRLGTVLFAGQIRQQRHHRSSYRPGALQCTAKNDAPNGVA